MISHAARLARSVRPATFCNTPRLREMSGFNFVGSKNLDNILDPEACKVSANCVAHEDWRRDLAVHAIELTCIAV